MKIAFGRRGVAPKVLGPGASNMLMNPVSKFVCRPILAVLLGVVAAPLLRAKQAVAAPVAISPYTLTALNVTPPAGATQPDDLAVSGSGATLWVGYGNGVDTTGKGGPSTLVQYNISTGAVLRQMSIPGHLDGLKINPTTRDIWATENEDGNPTLTVINHVNFTVKKYIFKPALITGGMDDLAFVGVNSQHVFIVTSSQKSSNLPVIVRISGPLIPHGTAVASALVGNPAAVLNVVTNTVETSDMIGDPDSMTLDPSGELVLDNRSDHSLYIARASGATNPVLRVPLTLLGAPVEVNDTIFTTSATTGKSSTAGVIYITDTTANKIYALTKPYFPSNEVYTAANVLNDVCLVDLNTGVVTPVVTGFAGVHGLAFSPKEVAIKAPESGAGAAGNVPVE
jgi:hypothetical protein